MGGYYDDVYTIVAQIPRGKVSTYGRIAQLTPVPRGARGWAGASGPERGAGPRRALVAGDLRGWADSATSSTLPCSASCSWPRGLSSTSEVMSTSSAFCGLLEAVCGIAAHSFGTSNSGWRSHLHQSG